MKKILGIVFVSMVLAFGCSGRKTAQGPTDTFVWNNFAEVATLDTALMEDNASSNVAWQIHEGLLEYDPKTLEPVPGVATHWDLSKEGRVYTFYLRKNAKWSNGDPVTAHDFVYSWQRVLDPKTASTYAYILYFIKNGEEFNQGKLKDAAQVGVKAIDNYTLQVTLKEPTPFFPQVVAYTSYRPVHRGSVEKWGNQWTRPEHIVTNGAYRVTSWILQKEILLSRNEYYWDKENVHIEKVKFLPVEERETALKLHLSGKIHFTDQLPYLKLPALKKREDFQNGPMLSVYYYELNLQKAPFDNLKVRQALNLAVDKKQIVETLQEGHTVAFNLIPPGIYGYVPAEGASYNPEKAKTLLAEAGYADPKKFPKFNIYYNTSENHKAIAEMVQNMWKTNLGIEVGIINQEWKVYLKTLNMKQFDVGRLGWIADYADPFTFLTQFTTTSQQNHTSWSNAEFDNLVLNLSSKEQDQKKRFKILQEAEAVFLQELPTIPLYHYARPILLDVRVKGFYHNARDIHPLKFARF